MRQTATAATQQGYKTFSIHCDRVCIVHQSKYNPVLQSHLWFHLYYSVCVVCRDFNDGLPCEAYRGDLRRPFITGLYQQRKPYSEFCSFAPFYKHVVLFAISFLLHPLACRCLPFLLFLWCRIAALYSQHLQACMSVYVRPTVNSKITFA